MKKIIITMLLGAIIILSGCSSKDESKNSKNENTDIETYCTSFGEICPQNENQCEFCGVTKVSSYASCHSKEFCKNTPMK
ncbi:hypothetical protein A2272_02965 [Candidatus Peregrinibacteria bacterium RIFOXYA12_FULL_33_12]|nr:MAG: hypothetical protein A2263_02295 [Candidatus Peregrinibacteria bacterium RIFOXYA2_FULL_33_21]OGJ46624.1 MAG: hypothetical protein A2272_02965 [Candidatus Peregrinibacteria bacterium RIFOXYA12_FULL_33_12]OGJ51536.1 MAG: hypothetical protein A2307_01080 [Candidatus Peregrinibacteria bacterium RIFOXYB2_FULL_33_20]